MLSLCGVKWKIKENKGREYKQMASETKMKRNFLSCQICILKAKEVKAIENEPGDF
jgi:hypothetical protein